MPKILINPAKYVQDPGELAAYVVSGIAGKISAARLGDHPLGDRLSVGFLICRELFDPVAYGVPEVQELPEPGVALIGFDKGSFDRDAALQDVFVIPGAHMGNDARV